jgi:hydroxypyruvate isomerase
MKFAANLSMLFTESPFLERFALAARAGFRGVEFLSPYEHDAADIADRLNAHALELALFNLPPGDWAGGERGIAIFQERQNEFRNGVALAVQYAKALDCERLHCLAGIAPIDANSETLLGTYIENLRFAAGEMRAIGATLLIEPINTRDAPGYFLTSCAQARDVISRVGAPNLRLQFDAYHAHIMEGQVAELAASSFDLIRHVQIADAPGRHEPGTGEIDFAELLSRLDALGYAGWIGCEYKPRFTTADGLSWFHDLIDKS